MYIATITSLLNKMAQGCAIQASLWNVNHWRHLTGTLLKMYTKPRCQMLSVRVKPQSQKCSIHWMEQRWYDTNNKIQTSDVSLMPNAHCRRGMRFQASLWKVNHCMQQRSNLTSQYWKYIPSLIVRCWACKSRLILKHSVSTEWDSADLCRSNLASNSECRITHRRAIKRYR